MQRWKGEATSPIIKLGATYMSFRTVWTFLLQGLSLSDVVPDTLEHEGVEVWSELVDDVVVFIFQYAGQVW